jgi:predicted nucleic acid-binding protein
VPVDLTLFVTSGVLTLCQPDDAQEQSSYVQYATLFRSDGEAMCLALAECRGWTVATDDRRAIHVAKNAGLSVVSCPELVKAWAERTRPEATRLVQVLADIQSLAQFRPNPKMQFHKWWSEELAKNR